MSHRLHEPLLTRICIVRSGSQPELLTIASGLGYGKREGEGKKEGDRDREKVREGEGE